MQKVATGSAAGKRLVDLSHEIVNGMTTYQGLPGPVITEHLSREASRGHYAPGTEFSIGRIDMVANTGTYVDSPFHRYVDGVDLAGLPLSTLVDLPGILVRATDGTDRAVGIERFRNVAVTGRAVLVRTGWDRNWGSAAYFEGHPFLTRESAEFLRDHGAVLVGIDSYNIDDTDDLTRPAHSVLLGAGIPIVEHLCGLEQLPEEGFRFFAAPPKVREFGSFPVRAFAICSPDPE